MSARCWRGCSACAPAASTHLVDGDRVVINWVFEMTGSDGVARVMDELALQTWDGDRIATERFYYDPAQILPPRS